MNACSRRLLLLQTYFVFVFRYFSLQRPKIGTEKHTAKTLSWNAFIPLQWLLFYLPGLWLTEERTRRSSGFFFFLNRSSKQNTLKHEWAKSVYDQRKTNSLMPSIGSSSVFFWLGLHRWPPLCLWSFHWIAYTVEWSADRYKSTTNYS